MRNPTISDLANGPIPVKTHHNLDGILLAINADKTESQRFFIRTVDDLQWCTEALIEDRTESVKCDCPVCKAFNRTHQFLLATLDEEDRATLLGKILMAELPATKRLSVWLGNIVMAISNSIDLDRELETPEEAIISAMLAILMGCLPGPLEASECAISVLEMIMDGPICKRDRSIIMKRLAMIR